MKNLDIETQLETYRGKKVAVLYSAGLDSSLLAHFLYPIVDELALIMCDCGYENRVNDPWFDPTKPEDRVQDIDQFVEYANIFKYTNTNTKLWQLRLPELNSQTVNCNNLLPDEAAAEIENNNVIFYVGFMAMRFCGALSLAAKHGHDHVVTGHLDFNSQYKDESLESAELMNQLFKAYYGSRLVKTPTLQMPWRLAGVRTSDLLVYNSTLEKPLDYNDTISCNVSVLHTVKGIPSSFKLRFGRQIHCGKCPHCLDRRASFARVGLYDNAQW